MKTDDNAATHPIVLRGAAGGGNVNELFGFVMRCALQSAGHVTDYVIEEGTAFLIGGQDADPPVLTQARHLTTAETVGLVDTFTAVLGGHDRDIDFTVTGPYGHPLVLAGPVGRALSVTGPIGDDTTTITGPRSDC